MSAVYIIHFASMCCICYKHVLYMLWLCAVYVAKMHNIWQYYMYYMSVASNDTILCVILHHIMALHHTSSHCMYHHFVPYFIIYYHASLYYVILHHLVSCFNVFIILYHVTVVSNFSVVYWTLSWRCVSSLSFNVRNQGCLVCSYGAQAAGNGGVPW